jgi:hypothetical protein
MRSSRPCSRASEMQTELAEARYDRQPSSLASGPGFSRVQLSSCPQRGSNTGPSDLQSDALPTELWKPRDEGAVDQREWWTIAPLLPLLQRRGR